MPCRVIFCAGMSLAALPAGQTVGIWFTQRSSFLFFFAPQRRHFAPITWNLAWRRRLFYRCRGTPGYGTPKQ